MARQLKIRMAFLLVGVGGLLLFVLGMLAFSDSFYRMTHLAETQRVAGSVTSSGFRLALLTSEFFLHAESRTEQQWRTLHAKLQGLLGEHQAELSPFAVQVKNINYNLYNLEKLFDTLLQHTQRIKENGQSLEGDEAYRIKASLVIIRVAELQSSVDELESAVRLAVERSLGASQHGLLFKLGLLFALTALLGGLVWWFFFIRLHRPLTFLAKGIDRIKAGEADFRPRKYAEDELGAVVDSFNALLDQQGMAKQILLEKEANIRRLADSLEEKNRIFSIIGKFQAQFIYESDPFALFDSLLQDIIDYSGSEFGFIGDVLQDEEGRDYLKCYALSNIAWNEETRSFYQENKRTGFVFKKLDNLFGHVITDRKIIIANDPAHDPLYAGLPPGHPPLNAFLGIPVWYGQRLVGVIGLANCPGGYDMQQLVHLHPVVDACGRVIHARWEQEARLLAETKLKDYRDTLQERVAERTRDLDLAHARLGETGFAMDRVGIGIHWVQVATGRLIYVNEHACAMLGYSQQEMLAMTVPDIDPNFSKGDYFSRVEAFINQQQARFETQNITKDGRILPVEVTLYYQPETPQAPAKFITFVTDISERKAAEEALLQAKESAESANRAKSVFLANMSHELRTPLNAILGFAQLMQRDSSVAPEHQENLAIINRSGNHLLELINDVLEISRIETGHTRLMNRPFNLHEFLTGIEEMFQVRADHKGITFQLEEKGSLPVYVEGDVNKLRQILINLLGNAIKFTHQGSVTLRVALESRHDDCVNLSFAVRDTGIGISVEDQARIFKPFSQAEAGEMSGEGTGLGLAISREFVHLLGGEFGLESVMGEGSIFRFEIPLQVVDEARVETERPYHKVIGLQPGQPRYRILICEDQADNRLLLRTLLEQVGFEVREAMDGEQGVARFKSWHPHLIWMDMRMPKMDGYEATRQIKATPEGQETVIVALTASAFEEDKSTVLAAGCDGFVRKPLQESEIFQVLEQLLGVRFLSEEGPQPSLSTTLNGLDPEALSSLPADVRQRLGEVARQLDPEALEQVAELVARQSQPLANTLKSMGAQFRFDLILDALDRLGAMPSDEPMEK